MSKLAHALGTVLVSLWVVGMYSASTVNTTGYTEAPTGFDNQTNGLVDQDAFDHVKGVFEEVDDAASQARAAVQAHARPALADHLAEDRGAVDAQLHR